MSEAPRQSRDRRLLVIQSHRQPLPWRWLERCLGSVRSWAEESGFDYRFVDDTLFQTLPPDLRHKTLKQPVVASDLARLLAIDEALAAGYDAVIWMDADSLVIDPRRLQIPDVAYALGREIWVQTEGGGYRARVKVHNAFLLFRAGNPFLDFYIHAADRIIRRHDGPMVPQLVGPKLLTALHNIIACPVVEEAAMLSPAVVGDLLANAGMDTGAGVSPALDLFRDRCFAVPAVVNLCGSLVSIEGKPGELTAAEVADVMDLLLANPTLLA